MIEFEIQISTKSELNQREHWAVKAKRTKRQRSFARYTTKSYLVKNELPSKPYEITMVRIGIRRLDVGNLSGSMKAVQDGLCDALGIEDDDRINKPGIEKHRWLYDQKTRGKKQGPCAVKVMIRTVPKLKEQNETT